MTREPIYEAVYQFFAALTVGGSPAFKLATRKAALWDSVAPEDQPALLQLQRRENANFRKGLPTIWTCEITLYLYVHTDANNSPDVVPSTLLNPLIDAIVGALTIDDLSNNCCTLGGLVSHCAVEGAIEIFEGNLGDQAVATIPIKFLVSP